MFPDGTTLGDAQSIFHAVFAEPTAEAMTPFVAAPDFSRYRVVADLGGAGAAAQGLAPCESPRLCSPQQSCVQIRDRDDADGRPQHAGRHGGRERSEAEWSSLLLSAGLELRRIVPVPGLNASIIESVPYDEMSAA
jgi:hypothetical protein